MTKEFDGFISDLPDGCITETDIYTDLGVLLCPRMTIIDKQTKAQLENYKGRIHAIVSYTPKTVTNPTEPEEDTSINFEDSFKKYAEESLSTLYANVDDVDSLASGIKEIGKEVYSVVGDSKDLLINLSKLKISDEYTYKHSVDVGTMSAVLAKSMGESNRFVHDVTLSGLLHDVGKEKIPNEVINKPAKLTPEEYEIIKTHPVHGYRLLMQTNEIAEDIRQGILNHHENIDGTGYPRGLMGDEIGKMGQIISIVDVYDALVTKRPYKDAKTPAQAIEIMFTMSNKFDMNLFKAFLAVINAYPNGSQVVLSTGETATVLKQNKSYPLRPVIKVNGTKKVINLASDLSYLSTVIIDFVKEN